MIASSAVRSPFANIINLLAGELTLEQASERLPETIAYWVKSHSISKKIQNEESRKELCKEFLGTYENFLKNEKRVVDTLLKTRLFRKLSKAKNSAEINANISVLASMPLPNYLETAAIAINPKAAAFQNDPHVISFIVNLFTFASERTVLKEEKEIIAPENYEPSQYEIEKYRVKLERKNAAQFFDWRSKTSQKMANDATKEKIRKKDFQDTIDALKTNTKPIPLVAMLEGYPGIFLKFISTPPFDKSFNLLREILILGLEKFLASDILQT